MSHDNVVGFMSRLASDDALALGVGQIERSARPEAVHQLVQLAEQAGYVFTESELEEVVSMLAQRIGGELNDEQLEQVAGGTSLQYLNLQQAMQDESRGFTLMSNIMKTKHDTAKNSISNVR